MIALRHEAILEHRAKGPWRRLHARAETLVDYTRSLGGMSFSPELGGSTHLMLAINHRISDDIDLFVPSPAWLRYISPEFNDDMPESPEEYATGNDFVKWAYKEGEVDFVATGTLLKTKDLWNPPAPETSFMLQAPAEILARKLVYRGWSLTARDLFDWRILSERAPANAIPVDEMAKWLSRAEKLADIS